MAKLSVTVTVIFFFLTVSQARILSNLPEDEVIDRELQQSLPGSDVSSVLRLPSDSVNDESHSTESSGDIPESESISVKSIPLRVVRFCPINHHFLIRSRSAFRNCRHHHDHDDHPFFKPIRRQQQQQHVEIPYGNDMILPTDENKEFDPLVFHQGRKRRIPARWVKLHNHPHHHDDDDHDDDGFAKLFLKHTHRFGKEKFKKHLLLHKDDHEEEEEENEEIMKKREGKRVEEDGFVNRIRKFLDHF